MKLFRRITRSLHDAGPRATFFKLYIACVDHWFDIKHRVDTGNRSASTALTVMGSNQKRGIKYAPTRIVPLRQLLGRVQTMIPIDSVLLDLGCGKGRVLMVASEFGFREARGIEFAHELADIAKRNCAAYQRSSGTETLFTIIESDVVDYAVRADENVFFLFNPFDDVVWSRVLTNILKSLETAPRPVWIICHNNLSRLDHVIDQQKRFVKVLEQQSGSYSYAVYSNAG